MQTDTHTQTTNNQSIRPIWSKFKQSKILKRQLTISQSKLIEEFENYAADAPEQSLVLTNTCECHVCEKPLKVEKFKKDLYLASTPEAHKNMFNLLQHLTLIKSMCASVLGEFLIPMFLFRRDHLGKKDQRKLKGAQHNFVLGEYANMKFVVFQTNEMSFELDSPIIVKSMTKVSSLIQKYEQDYRQNRKKFNRTLLKMFHNQKQRIKTDVTPNIHSKQFEQFIPSRIFTSEKKQMKVWQKCILHKQDRHLDEHSETDKLKQSQPFCIFRYVQQNESAEESKYQVFTMETLDAYFRKNQKIQLKNSKINESDEKLNLVCIESYTKIGKEQDGVDKKLQLGQKMRMQRVVQKVYFTSYQFSDSSMKQCVISKLARQQILIKINKITKIHPQYLDKSDLHNRISDFLQLNFPITTQIILKQVKYRTFKIVHVLMEICKIMVKSIKLKWVVNTNEDIVLVECLEYEFVGRSPNMKIGQMDDEDNQKLRKWENMIWQDTNKVASDNIDELVETRKQIIKSRKSKTPSTPYLPLPKISNSIHLHPIYSKRLSSLPMSPVNPRSSPSLKSNAYDYNYKILDLSSNMKKGQFFGNGNKNGRRVQKKYKKSNSCGLERKSFKLEPIGKIQRLKRKSHGDLL